MAGGRTALAAAVALIILAAAPFQAVAAGSYTRGSFRVVDSNNYGTSVYTIDYSYPSTIQVGQQFNVTLTLFVTNLTGLKLYLDNYSFSVNLLSPSGSFIGSAGIKTGVSRALYPGGHWGPVNVSVPIRPSAVGIGPGGSESANITVGTITSVFYDFPLYYDMLDTGSSSVGNVQVVYEGSPPLPVIPIAILVVVALVLVACVLVFLKPLRRSHVEADALGRTIPARPP